MKTEYRIILTATFDTLAEREKAYEVLKTFAAGDFKGAALFKGAGMQKDEYVVPEIATVAEKVI
jgi:hypothetical protein